MLTFSVSRASLTIASGVLFFAGGAALFAPAEIARLAELSPTQTIVLIVQLGASGLLGFALLNWMSRGQRLGGIYGRPLGMANLFLFTTTALTVARSILDNVLPASVVVLFAALAVLSAAFAWLVFLSDPLTE